MLGLKLNHVSKRGPWNKEVPVIAPRFDRNLIDQAWECVLIKKTENILQGATHKKIVGEKKDTFGAFWCKLTIITMILGDLEKNGNQLRNWKLSFLIDSGSRDTETLHYWPALLCCNFFGQPGSVSKFPPFLWVKLWVGWVGRGYTEISRYFPASWINWVTLVTKIKLLHSLRF